MSLLHVLSVVTLISLAAGLVAARRGAVQRHRVRMIGSYLGLCGAFIGAVAVPTRAIPTFTVTHPAGAVLALLASLGVASIVVLGARTLARVDRHRGESIPKHP